MKRALVLVFAAGCAYPEFSFAPPPVDSAVVDSREEPDTFVPADEGVDSAAIDTAPADTSCACGPGETCDPGGCQLEPSCKSIKAKFPSLASGAFMIDPDGSGPLTAFQVYCEMGVDGGGWTLALKADGAKTTFAYDSPLWTSTEVLNPTSTNTSSAEAKFRSYSELPFTQIRLRTFDGTTPRYFFTTLSGTSLRDLFAGPPITTTIGRARWLSLVPDPSLQDNCNQEGVNQQFMAGNSIRIRFGIVGNNEPDCDSANSFIGIGATLGDATGCYGGIDPGVVVGNSARIACGAAKDKSTRTVGFLFVR